MSRSDPAAGRRRSPPGPEPAPRRSRSAKRPRRRSNRRAARLQKPSAYYCYILECEDGTYYTGWTTDPERRLRQHSAGRGSRYTRAHPPARLAFVEPQPDRASAMRRERTLKQMSRARKQALIAESTAEDRKPK